MSRVVSESEETELHQIQAFGPRSGCGRAPRIRNTKPASSIADCLTAVRSESIYRKGVVRNRIQ